MAANRASEGMTWPEFLTLSALSHGLQFQGGISANTVESQISNIQETESHILTDFRFCTLRQSRNGLG